MSDSWNVPKRSNNCRISIIRENSNAILPLKHSIFFNLFPIFFRNVKIPVAENGTIMITFSMHSAVSFCSPSTVFHMPQPPMTLLNGFIHKLRFNRVRNMISEVTNVNKNSFRKNTLFLNFRHMSLWHSSILCLL